MLFVAFNSLFDKADGALREVAKEVKNWNGKISEEFQEVVLITFIVSLKSS